jgi:hypothetical protein
MTFQAFSKLYGSIQTCLKPATAASKLLLLGDCFPLNDVQTSKSKQLRDYCSSNWEKVYVLPGIVEICNNGQYSWMDNMNKFEQFIKDSPKQNVVIMNNSEFHDGDDILIGSTFWCGMGARALYHPILSIKRVQEWADEDAEFIAAAIKNAAIQNKRTTICTYFSSELTNPNANAIFKKQLENIKLCEGKWYMGISP